MVDSASLFRTYETYLLTRPDLAGSNWPDQNDSSHKRAAYPPQGDRRQDTSGSPSSQDSL